MVIFMGQIKFWNPIVVLCNPGGPQFKVGEEDSQIEVLLKEEKGATELILIHTNVPEIGEHYKNGWNEHYFQPMKTYFSKL